MCCHATLATGDYGVDKDGVALFFEELKRTVFRDGSARAE
jgi:hypothetical protein